MEILSLTSDAFRNLASARLEFHPRLNLIVGDNGQGKTNLLEALALVSGRASFRTRDLAEVREHLAPRTVLSARVRAGGDPRTDTTLGLVLAAGAREHYRDGKRVTRLRGGADPPGRLPDGAGPRAPFGAGGRPPPRARPRHARRGP